MKPANLLFILSDEHSRDLSGCYGHPQVQTPNIDHLAAGGTRFNAAYTNCPICVPARASLMTGQYVHATGHWENASPYTGIPKGWAHEVRDQGLTVDSIGKLHFRSTEDDNGFSQEIDPLHIVDGLGDLLSCIRTEPPRRNSRPGLLEAGPGDSTYLRYDASNAANALAWLEEHAEDKKPWVLFLSLVCPHPPFISPPDLFARYPIEDVPLPPQWDEATRPDHPTMAYFRHFLRLEDPLTETQVRQVIAAHYGVITYLDQQIGRVLDRLAELNLTQDTRILYTSDHGEDLGSRGLFGKFTMYEESAAVPLILSGPDVPAGRVVETPVSLVDCHPTILESVDISPQYAPDDLPGASLWSIAQEPDRDRTVFSEYHAVGTRNGYYMLRDRRYKYVYYVGARPQLFDLQDDPQELTDLATHPESAALLADFEARLRAILDPEAVDALAKRDQAARVAAAGGEEFVRSRGAFANSPAPGETPAFRTFEG